MPMSKRRPRKKTISADDSMIVRMTDRYALVLRNGWKVVQVEVTDRGVKQVGDVINLP
jgi:hypothetical protein